MQDVTDSTDKIDIYMYNNLIRRLLNALNSRAQSMVDGCLKHRCKLRNVFHGTDMQ
jgi:hypothetical protein